MRFGHNDLMFLEAIDILSSQFSRDRAFALHQLSNAPESVLD
jgi:hypothetical protein